ncbi:MAG: hypothetical protein AB8G99_09235 [Planctomycetaceae bacterium]
MNILLCLLWLYFPAGLLIAAFTGSIPAKGGPNGSIGLGHMACRKKEPLAFWMTLCIHAAMTFYVPFVVDMA